MSWSLREHFYKDTRTYVRILPEVEVSPFTLVGFCMSAREGCSECRTAPLVSTTYAARRRDVRIDSMVHRLLTDFSVQPGAMNKAEMAAAGIVKVDGIHLRAIPPPSVEDTNKAATAIA
eukprot:6186443-Pleurochrysis_carterae.AAC.3